jgi:very-short-patch-repair endonuclease
MKKSKGEEILAQHLTVFKIPFTREYKFHPKRKWRFDFMLERNIAIEVEGATWSGGRHTRGSGYIKDLEKYNQAALMGFVVLRFTTEQVMNGTAIDQIINALRD